MNLPNLLTLIRIFLVPLLIVALLYWQKNLTATIIFSVAAFTDWLDGHLARSRNQVTDFGRLLDPVADKLLISAALISLVGLDRAPAWLVVILVGRELAVTAFRGIMAIQGFVLEAERMGKLKLISQIIAIIMLMSNLAIFRHYHLGEVFLYIATALTLISGVSYFYHHWRHINPRK